MAEAPVMVSQSNGHSSLMVSRAVMKDRWSMATRSGRGRLQLGRTRETSLEDVEFNLHIKDGKNGFTYFSPSSLSFFLSSSLSPSLFSFFSSFFLSLFLPSSDLAFLPPLVKMIWAACNKISEKMYKQNKKVSELVKSGVRSGQGSKLLLRASLVSPFLRQNDCHCSNTTSLHRNLQREKEAILSICLFEPERKYFPEVCPPLPLPEDFRQVWLTRT